MRARSRNAVFVILEQRIICKKYYGSVTSLAVVTSTQENDNCFPTPKEPSGRLLGTDHWIIPSIPARRYFGL